MAKGKIIRIYLADGTATGIRHAELVNWTGQAVACPRSRVGELGQWNEAKRPGVYVLFGYDDETGRNKAYIGESENVYERFQGHLRNKDFWNELIFFTSKDENLTKAHVKYLEARVTELAKSANRYQVENGNTPQRPSLPRGDRDSMEEFLEQAQGLLGVLGHRLLEPLAKPQAGITTDLLNPDAGQEPLSLSGIELALSAGGLSAKAVLSDEGIVVRAGSQAAAQVSNSLSPGYRTMRQKLIDAGVLKDEGSHFVFTTDQLFANPSPAAAIVVGYATNGRKDWKDANGRTIRDIENLTQ